MDPIQRPVGLTWLDGRTGGNITITFASLDAKNSALRRGHRMREEVRNRKDACALRGRFGIVIYSWRKDFVRETPGSVPRCMRREMMAVITGKIFC